MALCTISGTVVDPSAVPLSGISVSFNIQNPILSADPVQGSTTTDSSGNWQMDLQQGLSGIFTILTPSGVLGRKIPYSFNANIPNSSTASFSSILVDS